MRIECFKSQHLLQLHPHWPRMRGLTCTWTPLFWEMEHAQKSQNNRTCTLWRVTDMFLKKSYGITQSKHINSSPNILKRRFVQCLSLSLSLSRSLARSLFFSLSPFMLSLSLSLYLSIYMYICIYISRGKAGRARASLRKWPWRWLAATWTSQPCLTAEFDVPGPARATHRLSHVLHYYCHT